MARTPLAVQQISRAGLEPQLAAANVDGHSVQNDGRVYIEVDNADVAPITVIVQTPGQVDGLDVADRQETVPAGERRKFGPYSPGNYNQSDRTILVDFSAVTSVTVGAFSL